ncbi:sterol desaturase family protein [Erythrobacter sp. SCSIO 43205]|uniref:sterol desaturase family protein n=1 Tax=Erythrobacter sp. SCSIO 43205 TaxID=2779361 RepID=UPI001CA8D3E2|nr:sterol desaturase family protein [Erythrobacter sp. SCSIO 43205]UAB79535.1 sterol desaturase family protein [Erythrobacter sp. SCSIO 43205]
MTDTTTFETAIARAAEHFATVLYFDLSRYLITAGALTVLLLVFRSWSQARRIQGSRKASRADYLREVLSSFRTVLIFSSVALVTLAGRELGVIALKLESASLLTVAWQFALIVLAHDAYFYWAHRAMHTKPLFRISHLHHHKSRTPTPWTAYSFASLEAVIEAAFMPTFLIITSALGIQYSGIAVLLFFWHMMIRNVMAHAGSELFPAGWVDNPLTRWISTTTHHDLHHSSGHNYGFYFTFWDRMMGTEHPRYRQEFRKNARPLFSDFRIPRLSRRKAEKLSVSVAALLAAATTLNGWLVAVDPAFI